MEWSPRSRRYSFRKTGFANALSPKRLVQSWQKAAASRASVSISRDRLSSQPASPCAPVAPCCFRASLILEDGERVGEGEVELDLERLVAALEPRLGLFQATLSELLRKLLDGPAL